MILESRNIHVEIDEKTGFITTIKNGKRTGNNYVLSCSDWGEVTNFSFDKVRVEGNFVVAYGKMDYGFADGYCDDVAIKVTRKIVGKNMEETYEITNRMKTDLFINEECFGFHFPVNCLLDASKTANEQNAAIAHVWCGDNTAWLIASDLKGGAETLAVNLIEGSIGNYEIYRDVSKTPLLVNYRGDVVMLPSRCILKSGQTARYSFLYAVTEDPFGFFNEKENALSITAERFSYFCGEEGKFKVFSNSSLPVTTYVDNCQITGKHAESGEIEYKLKGLSVGEHTVDVYCGKNHTFAKINVLDKLENILINRARFIVENQQYLDGDSPLYGAYLIYDDGRKDVYYKWDFADYNVGRERIAMGIVVLRAYGFCHDEKLFDSAKLHLDFVLRELVDEKTGEVYFDAGRDETYVRTYNYPWFADYFFEWYRVARDKYFLEIAFRIMKRFYGFERSFVEDGQMNESREILLVLKNEQMQAEYDELLSYFVKQADAILQKGMDNTSDEILYVNEVPNGQCAYLSDVYSLTHDEKYLSVLPQKIAMSYAFVSRQPDFHMHAICVRHWDGFFFGKYKSIGDLYPQYWSALFGWALDKYERATGDRTYRDDMISCVLNNLCVFRQDGFAAANYLYPYKINAFASEPGYKNPWTKTGVEYGKRYDDFANDQDWALYIALKVFGK